MSYRRIAVIASTLSLLIIVLVSGTGCNYTRHIPEGQHLLRSNSIKVRSNQNITRRGELKDNLEGLVSQKPNTYILWFPYKLWLYNQRYDKYQKDTSNFQLKSKTVEPPVIYDSSSKRRSVLNMKSYLFNQGLLRYQRQHDQCDRSRCTAGHEAKTRSGIYLHLTGRRTQPPDSIAA